jgi:hypothetical protein
MELSLKRINQVYFSSLVLCISLSLLVTILIPLVFQIPSLVVYFTLTLPLLIIYLYFTNFVRIFSISISSELEKKGKIDVIWKEFEEMIKEGWESRGYQIKKWDDNERIIQLRKGFWFADGSLNWNFKNSEITYQVKELKMPYYSMTEAHIGNTPISYEELKLSEKDGIVTLTIEHDIAKKGSFSHMYAVTKSLSQTSRLYEKHGFKINKIDAKVVKIN